MKYFYQIEKKKKKKKESNIEKQNLEGQEWNNQII